MNNYLIHHLNLDKSKLNGYVGLLNLRYNNLCVKAYVESLLSANVVVDGASKNLEDVADVFQPNDYELGVVPKHENYLSDIVSGVFDAHPEFKVAIKLIDPAGCIKDPGENGEAEEGDTRFILYTMPEVDKDRRDLLTNGVKGLYDECKVRLDAVKTACELWLDTKGVLLSSPEEISEAKDEINDYHQQSRDMSLKLKDDKLEEIEEGYQRYLKAHPEALYDSSDGGFSVTQSMKIT